jgi:predicted MPP superfamily phosphohydrolase
MGKSPSPEPPTESGPNAENPRSGEPQKPDRRRFLAWGVRLALLAGSGYGFWERRAVDVERVAVPVEGLPPAFRGFRIAQISDLHASFWVGRGFLDRVVDQVNGLRPDVAVVTGDFVTGAVNQLWGKTGDADYGEQAAESLAGLQAPARFGVLGNHDQGEGEKETRRLVKRLETAGIRMLRNESTVLRRGENRLHVAGTDDFWHSSDVGAALREIPPSAPTLLLAHNPDAVADIPSQRRVDLTLCGHTHGGQVVIPFLTRRILPIRSSARYMAGLVQEPRGFTYVNRGIGTLVFPFRFGAPPEITEITLV